MKLSDIKEKVADDKEYLDSHPKETLTLFLDKDDCTELMIDIMWRFNSIFGGHVMLCTCGSEMNKPIKKPSGLLEFVCPSCRRSVIRSTPTSTHTERKNKHAGQKVNRWM